MKKVTLEKVKVDLDSLNLKLSEISLLVYLDEKDDYFKPYLPREYWDHPKQDLIIKVLNTPPNQSYKELCKNWELFIFEIKRILSS